MVSTKAQLGAAVRCSIILAGGSDSSRLGEYLRRLGETEVSADYEYIIVNDQGLEIDERKITEFLPRLRILGPARALTKQQLFDRAAMAASGRFLLFVRNLIAFNKLVLEESINNLEVSGEKFSISAKKNFVLVENPHYSPKANLGGNGERVDIFYKISFIEPHLKTYGGIRRIVELANRLVERGHDVTIFHSDGSPCKWMKCYAETKSYDEVLKEEHDVIIYNDPNPIDYKLVEKAKAKLKVFYVLELYEKSLLKGINPKIYLPWKRRMLFLKKSLQSPYLKLTNSSWLFYWLRENMHIDSKLLIGGVNTELFHPVKVEKRPGELWRILCSGDPRQRKGTKTVFEAVVIARREEPRIVLDTYYGKGISQEKMAVKYSSADIFVDGQLCAGWNNPVAEAMACGLPVVCTDIGGVKDFAFNEKTSLLVPAENPEAMASAILRLIKDGELRERLRKNAYQHIRQFQWDKSTEKLEEIIQCHLTRKKEPLLKINIVGHTPKQVLSKGGAIFKRVLQKQGGFDKYKKRGAYHWDSYKRDPIYRDHVDYIVESFSKVHKGSLLDVGCGDGLISSLLSESGFEVKGIDADREAIRLAQSECPRVNFEVKNVYDMNGQFDYLLASEVIEHLSNPDEFLQKIKRLFKRRALITTPKRDYYKQPDPYHFAEYSILEYESLLEKYFENVQVGASEYHLYAWIDVVEFGMRGDFNPSYVGSRDDIVKLIPNGVKKVLDVGCSVGTLGESVKQRNGAEVVGIEVDEKMANVAKGKLDHVIVGDIEKINLSDYFSPNCFDCIIFADVLEHLKDGWKLLARSVNLLNENGVVIASIPNVRHYSTIFTLLFRGIWPYRDRGIHDRTHLRFFTLKNIREMFQDAALEIIGIERKYRIIERPHRYNRFSRYFAYLFPKDFLTFQYLVVARKKLNKNL